MKRSKNDLNRRLHLQSLYGPLSINMSSLQISSTLYFFFTTLHLILTTLHLVKIGSIHSRTYFCSIKIKNDTYSTGKALTLPTKNDQNLEQPIFSPQNRQ